MSDFRAEDMEKLRVLSGCGCRDLEGNDHVTAMMWAYICDPCLALLKVEMDGTLNELHYIDRRFEEHMNFLTITMEYIKSRKLELHASLASRKEGGKNDA